MDGSVAQKHPVSRVLHMRDLRLEQLEDRALLSISIAGQQAALPTDSIAPTVLPTNAVVQNLQPVATNDSAVASSLRDVQQAIQTRLSAGKAALQRSEYRLGSRRLRRAYSSLRLRGAGDGERDRLVGVSGLDRGNEQRQHARGPRLGIQLFAGSPRRCCRGAVRRPARLCGGEHGERHFGRRWHFERGRRAQPVCREWNKRLGRQGGCDLRRRHSHSQLTSHGRPTGEHHHQPVPSGQRR